MGALAFDLVLTSPRQRARRSAELAGFPKARTDEDLAEWSYGESVRTVWSGSENWSGTSFLNDELIIHMTGKRVHKKYLKQFRLLWNGFTHPVGVHPIDLP